MTQREAGESDLSLFRNSAERVKACDTKRKTSIVRTPFIDRGNGYLIRQLDSFTILHENV
jgi:hypothetical protein